MLEMGFMLEFLLAIHRWVSLALKLFASNQFRQARLVDKACSGIFNREQKCYYLFSVFLSVQSERQKFS